MCWSQVIFLDITLEEALAKSKTEDKLVFVDFRADWCKPCVAMENTTFQDKTVGEKINQNYIPIKVDVDFFSGMDIQEAYNDTVLPTLLLLNGNGDVQLRLIGQKTATSLLSELGFNSNPITDTNEGEIQVAQPQKKKWKENETSEENQNTSEPNGDCFIKKWWKSKTTN